jgi:hypothetical protein
MEPFQWNNDIDDNFLELVHWINPGFNKNNMFPKEGSLQKVALFKRNIFH